jgi:uncharacterized protein (TIGR02452 family)
MSNNLVVQYIIQNLIVHINKFVEECNQIGMSVLRHHHHHKAINSKAHNESEAFGESKAIYDVQNIYNKIKSIIDPILSKEFMINAKLQPHSQEQEQEKEKDLEQELYIPKPFKDIYINRENVLRIIKELLPKFTKTKYDEFLSDVMYKWNYIITIILFYNTTKLKLFDAYEAQSLQDQCYKTILAAEYATPLMPGEITTIERPKNKEYSFVITNDESAGVTYNQIQAYQKYVFASVILRVKNYMSNDFFHSTTKSNFSDVLDAPAANKYPPIYVRNMDVLDLVTIISRIYEINNVLVLNLANNTVPGGGVMRGASAQEEAIFRRTNACLTLESKLYPIDNDNENSNRSILYSPQISIISDKMNRFYDTMSESASIIRFAMVSSAAKSLPENSSTHDERKLAYKLAYGRLKTVFKAAVLRGHKIIILGAYGCGAFHNDPDIIYEIFYKLIKKYGKYFIEIYFAILKVKNDTNDVRNYNVFINMQKEEFGPNSPDTSKYYRANINRKDFKNKFIGLINYKAP